ncbi:MAG: glycosyltransferase [Candidatus Falkowbacteria bacterium]|nr:glycosyltransferase [Candidatus Falkowbacteria bacterium]
MKRKIIVINSCKEDLSPIYKMFEGLDEWIEFELLNSCFNSRFKSQFKEKGWPTNFFLGWFFLESNWSLIPFLLVYPVYLISYFFYFGYLIISKKSQAVICISKIDKLTATIVARIFGQKVIWIELPNERRIFESKILKFLYKLNVKFCHKIIVVSDYTRDKLNVSGVSLRKILKISPGLSIENYQHQDDIFNNIALKNRKIKGHRYYTLGVITELNGEINIKILFQAISRCLETIPNIQLIIIGDGKEKKNLMWLAKTMKLETLIWFVGKQVNLGKWINSFDCFVVPNEIPTIIDYNTIISVMYGGVPIIAQRHVGLEGLIVNLENKLNTLTDINNCDSLNKKIIEVEQDIEARQKIGGLQKEKVKNELMLDTQILSLKEILMD